MTLVDDLEKLDAGDVSHDNASLMRVAHDTSLFEVIPQAVVAPRNIEDIKRLVRYASEHPDVSLTMRAGGSGMDGGALSSSVVVDSTAHMNAIGSFTESTGTVQPGAWYRDFERESLKRDLLMPSYPASRELCAIGGMVANNAGGELTLRYGKTADYVRELGVVLSDGNEYRLAKLSREELEDKLRQTDFEGDLYRRMYKLITDNADTIKRAQPKVSKNSSGYALWDVHDTVAGTFDLTRVFTGSQGTLGIITDITFDLVRPATNSQMLVVFLDDLSDLPAFVTEVLRHEPTTFESYDDKTLRLAIRFFSEFIKRLGFRKTFSIAWNNIGAGFSLLTRGLPKLVLQITFDGDDKVALRARARVLAEDIERFNPRFVRATRSDAELDEYWLIRRESFNLLRTKVKGKSTAPFIDDIVLPIETLAEALPKINAILAEYDDHMVHNIAGHIGNGNFHIIPLMDLSDPKVRAIIPEVMHRIYDVVIEHDGSISGEHNDGMIRTPFVHQQFGDGMYALFEETKRIFDPKNIFNPGKKVGGTLEDALKHLKKA